LSFHPYSVACGLQTIQSYHGYEVAIAPLIFTELLVYLLIY